jgi:hypothetical protein
MSPEERLAALNVHRLPSAEPPATPPPGDGKPQTPKKPPRFPLVRFDNVLMSTTSF